MKPAFLLRADGADVTATFADRLVDLTVTDEDGRTSDRLRITLDNRDGQIDLPELGVALDLWLGFAGAALAPMGRFVADGLTGRRPPQQLMIAATAADMTGTLRRPKTRVWADLSLGDIVKVIASEAGLIAAVSATLSGITWPVIAQTAESDLNLLTRLARDLDATAKPAGGALVVVGRDEGLNAEGDPIETVPLDESILSSYRWEQSEREDYASVEAEWGNLDAGDNQVITIGNGEPVRRLRHVYATADEATRVARAELAMAGRARLRIEAEIAGFRDTLFAGGKIALSGIGDGIDGDFLIRRVEHRLDTALTTSLSAERAT